MFKGDLVIVIKNDLLKISDFGFLDENGRVIFSNPLNQVRFTGQPSPPSWSTSSVAYQFTVLSTEMSFPYFDELYMTK